MGTHKLPTQTDTLADTFGRRFVYLRLSLTEVCNFRCTYCLPNGFRTSRKQSFMDKYEIKRLVDAFSELGIEKIRLTGGEPTLRKDFADIAATISENKSIKKLAFTTNGYRLQQNAKAWRSAGLTHINVSLDSLGKNRFHTLTGHNRLEEVLRGIDAALDAGFEKVKINTVLLKGINDQDLPLFQDMVKNMPIDIRFIELMQTGENFDYFRKHHLSSEIIKNNLRQQGWQLDDKSRSAGPAQNYSHSDYQGRIGIIAPYAKDFCNSCNRLRITATGDLRLCLFGRQGVALRHLLQEDDQKPLLKHLIADQLKLKASSHFLGIGDTGITPHLASVGG